MVKGNVSTKEGFYVGDICYALNDTLYDEVWGLKHDYKDGIWECEDGFKFAVAGTKYGDGEYVDEDDCYSFPVDAGVIGVVPFELLKDEFKNNLDELEMYGTYFEGAGEAYFESENGEFYIELPDGEHISIDTECYDDEEENDDE